MDEEYIKTLSIEEKIVFLKIFCCLIRADGNIDKEEIDFLKHIAAKYGIDNSTTVQIIKNSNAINPEYEAGKITTRQHGLELLKELCFLANIDENLHEKELDVIIAVGRAMNIEDEKIVLINRFVLDNLILSKTGRIILERNDNEL